MDLFYKEVRNVDKEEAKRLQFDGFVDSLTKKLEMVDYLSDQYIVLPDVVYLDHDIVKDILFHMFLWIV